VLPPRWATERRNLDSTPRAPLHPLPCRAATRAGRRHGRTTGREGGGRALLLRRRLWRRWVAGTDAAAALPEPCGARRGCLGRSMAASASAMADVVVVECSWRRRSSPPSAWFGLASPRRWGLFPAAMAWIRADPARWWRDPAPLCWIWWPCASQPPPLQRHLRHRGG
jgi:hypothetical protein